MTSKADSHQGGARATSHLWLAVKVVATALVITYPVLVFVGIKNWGPQGAAIVLACLMFVVAVLRLASESTRVRSLGLLPFITVALLATSAALDETVLMLFVPAITNFLLLLTFSMTLFKGPSMIERFARLIEPELSAAKVQWCRRWTMVWCVFFCCNALVALATALWFSLDVWALYNGLVAYGLVGVLFAVEWTLRRWRFPDTRKARAF